MYVANPCLQGLEDFLEFTPENYQNQLNCDRLSDIVGQAAHFTRRHCIFPLG
jgi:hypothetical protein